MSPSKQYPIKTLQGHMIVFGVQEKAEPHYMTLQLIESVK